MQNSTNIVSEITEVAASATKPAAAEKPRAMSYLAMRKRQEMSRAAAATKEKEETEIAKNPAEDDSEAASKQKCEECGANRLITNSVQGNIVCQACGLVQSSRIIDESAEWRSFGASEGGDSGKADMNRVGGKTNPYLSNAGLETNVIGTNATQYAKWLIKGN
jgi:hypothetical protein